MTKSLPRRGLAPETSDPKARPPGHAVPTLILFDIDGTLVLTGGAGVRAMTRAFAELFAIDDAFAGIPMAGRTDSRILADAVERHGLAGAGAIADFPRVYAAHLAHAIHEPGPRKGVMPGIRTLLDELSNRRDAHLALLTGNYRSTAQLKLEHFDLWRYFRGGAFGDDAADRDELLPRAVADVVSRGGPCVDPCDAIVIGDTPLDVACAQASRARCVAVATGTHSADELRQAGADVVFEDLSDLDAVLSAFALRGLS